VTARSYRVQVNGRSYTVTVELDGQNKFRATIDGQTFRGESLTAGDIMTWGIQFGEERVSVRTQSLPNDKVDVWLSGTPFQTAVQLLGGNVLPEPKARDQPVVSEIRALMPGRVTSILVKDNDAIELGTPLLLLEAMKMQNEITSPMKGRVTSIKVQEGTTVKKDAVLVEIA
jgi:biotin carboxyl carrier protein